MPSNVEQRNQLFQDAALGAAKALRGIKQ